MRRVGVGLLGCASLLTPAAVVGLLCLLFLVTAEMPGRSWARRLLFGVVSLFALNAGILTLLAVLHRSCEPRLLVGVLLVAAVCWQRLRPSRARVTLVTATDLWSGALGAVGFALLYGPMVGASTGRTMALLSQTTDGANHAQILVAVTRAHGYVHLAPPRGMTQGADTYPAAWHGNAWILLDLLHGSAPGVSDTVRLLGLLAVAGYSLLLTAGAALTLELLALRGLAGARWTLLALALLASSLLVGFGLFFLELGSYTQIVAVACLLVAALASVSLEQSSRSLVVLCACVVAVMQCWYLLAPVVAVLVLLALTRLRPGGRALAVATVVVVPLSAYPLLVGPSASQSDASGPTLLPTISGVLGLLLATALGCWWALRSGGEALGVVVCAGAVTTLLVLVLLIVRQGFEQATGLSYYGAKVLLTGLLWGAVLSAAAVPVWLAGASHSTRALALAACAGLVLGTVSTARVSLPPRTTLDRDHPEVSTLDALVRDHPEGPRADTETWAIDGCDRVRDMITSKWMYDVWLGWSDDLRDDMTAYADSPSGDTSVLTRRLERPGLRELELYVHRDCDPAALRVLQAQPKVRVIRVP